MLKIDPIKAQLDILRRAVSVDIPKTAVPFDISNGTIMRNRTELVGSITITLLSWEYFTEAHH